MEMETYMSRCNTDPLPSHSTVCLLSAGWPSLDNPYLASGSY